MDLALETDVLAARTGDRLAFGRLVTRYGAVVTSISLSTVRNVATSEEIAQDVFLAAWRDLASLRNPASFLPWLRQLTRHRALDVVRARRPALDEETLAAAIDPRPGAEDALLDDERAAALAAALDALPSDAREVLTLFYREGRSVTQVAHLLGLREDTVKKRLSRARASLRDEVLARFADAVESTAPGDGFARQVIVALPVLSPASASAVVLGKGAAHIAVKWAGFAAVGMTGLAGLLAGGIPIVSGLNRCAAQAIDDRERRGIAWIRAVTLANLALFCFAVPFLRGSPHSRLFSTLWAFGFTLLHMGIYFVWLPRVTSRRRQAQVGRDPGAAERYARHDRRQKLWAAVSSLVIFGVVAAMWLRD
jgi:RNA polymerase sigma factor (sigma-70 family)